MVKTEKEGGKPEMFIKINFLNFVNSRKFLFLAAGFWLLSLFHIYMDK